MTDDMGFSVELKALEETSDHLAETGFTDIVVRDRHDRFRAYAKNDLENLKGPRKQAYIDVLGKKAAQLGIEMNEKLVSILYTGELRPGHLRAYKPR